MEKANLVRVIFEHKDGTVNFLDGKQAQTWYEAMQRTSMLDFFHGGAIQKELKKLKLQKAPNLKTILKSA